jgi:HD-GYP domain-containing protein (c-di-GMP phosphodiesterase class II)
MAPVSDEDASRPAVVTPPPPVATAASVATPAPATPIVFEEPAPAPVIPTISAEEARGLYNALLNLARRLFAKDVDYEKFDTRPVTSLVSQVVHAVETGDENLLELSTVYVLKDASSYLVQHAVNVAILSVVMGHGLRYETERLRELGIAAYLHDIGMTQYEDMASQPRLLLKKEMEQIKNHVLAGDKILKKMSPSLSEAILSAQYEIHERVDGSGYPAGRHGLNEYAKIISLVDAFESMMHPRPFRERYAITEVYKRIFDAKEKFDQSYIKVLVERLGFFPNGSFVQLNTKEVARVIAQNRKSPLRPVVRILFAENGRKLFDDETKDVDLLRFPTLHVLKCFLQEA